MAGNLLNYLSPCLSSKIYTKLDAITLIKSKRNRAGWDNDYLLKILKN